MKPLRVDFAAFGSYPGEVSVDFTPLAARGLFVVTGETGSGKTTIFDAMSYALFGEMPLKPGQDIRSHHADASRATFARFTFEVDRATYVAERSPEQQRPAARGGGMAKEAAKASLTRLEGNTSVALATKVSEMKRAVAEVIGLDAEQFQRVMLLPQGEVAKFLLDDSNEREQLLSALFGGEVYNRIAGVLQDEAGRLKAHVGQADEALRHHLSNAITRAGELVQLLDLDVTVADDAEREVLGPLLDVCSPEVEELGTAAASARDAAGRDAAALTEARQAAVRYRDAARLGAEMAEINERVPEVESLARAAERSQLARPVVLAAQDAASGAATYEQASNAVDEARVALVTLAEQHSLAIHPDDPAVLADDVAAIETMVREHTDVLSRLHAAAEGLRDAEKDLHQHRERQRALGDDMRAGAEALATLSARIAELDADAVDVAALEDAHRRLSEALDFIAKRDQAAAEASVRADEMTRAEHESERVLRRFIETRAPRLAAQLRPGDACPVCGSLEHPALASSDDGDPVDLDAVAAAQAVLDAARQALLATNTRVTEARARLGDWSDAVADELHVLARENRRQFDEAVARREELDRLVGERENVAERCRASQSDLDRLAGVITAGEATVARVLEAHRVAVADAAHVDAERLAEVRVALHLVKEGVSTLNTRRSAAVTAAAVLKAAVETLERTLRASGFDDAAEADAAMMPIDEERLAIEQREDLKARLATCQGQLQTLEQQGIPEVLPDVDAFVQAAYESQEHARVVTERHTLADKALVDLMGHLEQYDAVGEQSQSIRRRAQLTERAQLVCRGVVGTKVSLRRWVLGRELDRVVAAGSVHLAKMTSGRYSIRRVEDPSGGRSAKGLDLEVLDAHTGRPRSPRTLSGGEQFQASLALALGLADVVSHGGTGSGRRIEALFIDEGFGSLDPRALDDAIETLHQLHASGRMVGAITHVEAMKERLHPGIVVKRLPDGRGSTLSVNP